MCNECNKKILVGYYSRREPRYRQYSSHRMYVLMQCSVAFPSFSGKTLKEFSFCAILNEEQNIKKLMGRSLLNMDLRVSSTITLFQF
jgi:hypothetical protein